MSADKPGASSSRSRLLAASIAGASLLAVLSQVAPLLRLLDDGPGATAAAVGSVAPETPGARSAARPAMAPPGEGYSNIYRYDYVGPEACARCHASMFDSWRTHPHSRMNRNATATSVVGDFSGVELHYADGKAVFGRGGGEYTMSLFYQGQMVRRYKVTRTIGSRFVQMYTGVQVEGPEPRDSAVYTQEVKLPFAFWIGRKQWFPQTYDETPSVPEYNEKGELNSFYAYYEKATGSWKRVCAKCHNTYAYATRMDAAPEGKLMGFPAADVSLPNARHIDPEHPLSELEPWELVTLGISCESCHFGGREHALNGASISFVPRAPELQFPRATDELVAHARQSNYAIVSICGQCHRAEVVYPPYPDGSSTWNSQEAREMPLGACASQIKCTDCHNPHVPGPTTPEAAEQPAHSEACVRCHEKLRAPAAASAHAGHPAGVKVSCLDCHMPRVVHGLAGMTRSHRISSPTNPQMLTADMPNACNLCHLDRPLQWTLDALESRWHRKVDLGAFKPSSKPFGEVWLGHSSAVVRQAAASAYAGSPLGKSALPLVLPILNDPSPPSRMFGLLAVERILGRRLSDQEYTPWAAPSARAQAVIDLAKPRAP